MYQVFVSNFQRETKSWELDRFLSQYITNFKVKRSKNKGTKCTPHAIVTLTFKQDQALLLSTCLFMEKRQLSISEVKSKDTLEKEKLQRKNRTIFFSVNTRTESSDVFLDYFSKFGKVERFAAWPEGDQSGLVCSKVVFYEDQVAQRLLSFKKVTIQGKQIALLPYIARNQLENKEDEVPLLAETQIIHDSSASNDEKKLRMDWFGFRQLKSQGLRSKLLENIAFPQEVCNPQEDVYRINFGTRRRQERAGSRNRALYTQMRR